MALYPPWFFDNSSLDTGLIINPADDQNAPIGIVAYYTSPGLLLLFYIKIETLPIGSAAAWDISEELQYTLTKNVYQQAGSDLVLPQIEGAQSGAWFQEPSAYCPPGGIENGGCSAIGSVYNKLTDVNVDRTVQYPTTENLESADFYAQLTQGGSATMATHSETYKAGTTPEIVGTATAYQNLFVGGGFGKVDASFDSTAVTGMKSTDPDTNNWVVTDLAAGNKATVSTNFGNTAEFMEANLGAQVTAGIEQDWKGSGWLEPTYSGGLTMWAGFDGACDPTCANPIMSTVSGSAATSIFPGIAGGNNGADAYWNYGALGPNTAFDDQYDGWTNNNWAA